MSAMYPFVTERSRGAMMDNVLLRVDRFTGKVESQRGPALLSCLGKPLSSIFPPCSMTAPVAAPLGAWTASWLFAFVLQVNRSAVFFHLAA